MSTTHKSSWWSRSKPSKDSQALRSNRSATSLSEKQSMKSTTSTATSKSKDHSTSMFNSLVASAMGKKHKRPTLTIQDPPPPLPILLSPTSPQPPPVPSKSPNPSLIQSPVSSTSSRRPPVEINTLMHRRYRDIDQASDPHTVSEPRTPSDHPRDRLSYQTSVMTLSDPDPFASAGIPFSPQILDPNRLSAYSDTSLLDPSSSKRSDIVFTNNRISYGSSSSNSHGHHSDIPTARSHLHPPLPTAGPGQVLRRTSDSCVPPRRHARQMSGDNDDASMVLPPNHFMSHTRGTPTKPSGGSASSQSTLTQHDNRQNKQSATSPSRHDEFPPVPRPPTIRARGMTVAGVVHNPRRPSTAAGALEFSSQASSRMGGIHTTPRDTLSIPSPVNSSTTPSPFAPITHTNRTRTSSFNNNINRPASATATSPVSINGTRPLVLVRKASSPRVAMPPPPATPPSSGLPPPPSSPGSQSFIDSVDDLSSLVFPNHDRPSSSSSSLSFASDAGIDFARGVELDLDLDRGDEIYSLMRDSFVDSELRGIVPTPPQSPPATIRNVNIGSPPSAKSSLSLATRMHPGDSAHPRLLKKAVSQQNMLGKRFSGNSIASSIMSGSGSGGEDFAGTLGMGMGPKVPRKQRSFHHPRIPLPPLPSLRHSSSTNNSPEVSTASSSQSQAHSHSEHKKNSVSSPPSTRKRLFSGSSSTRRSSSSQPPASPTSLVDEDIRSIISIDRDGSGSVIDIGPGLNEGKKQTTHERRKPLMMSFSNLGSLVTESVASASVSWDEVVHSPGSAPPPPPPKDSTDLSLSMSMSSSISISGSFSGAGSSPRKANRESSQSEALAQRIMSPAAMLKLEEQLAEEERAKEREKEEERRAEERKAKQVQHQQQLVQQEQSQYMHSNSNSVGVQYPHQQKTTPKLVLDADDLGLTYSPTRTHQHSHSRRPRTTPKESVNTNNLQGIVNRSRAGSTISDLSVATFGRVERISSSSSSTVSSSAASHLQLAAAMGGGGGSGALGLLASSSTSASSSGHSHSQLSQSHHGHYDHQHYHEGSTSRRSSFKNSTTSTTPANAANNHHTHSHNGSPTSDSSPVPTAITTGGIGNNGGHGATVTVSNPKIEEKEIQQHQQHHHQGRFPVRSTSVLVGTSRSPRPSVLTARPSTAQAAMSSSGSGFISPSASSSMSAGAGTGTPPPMGSPVGTPTRTTSSLPPPPRPRPRQQRVPQDDGVGQVFGERRREEEEDAVFAKRASVLPLHPLSPPPRRKGRGGGVVMFESTHSQPQQQPQQQQQRFAPSQQFSQSPQAYQPQQSHPQQQSPLQQQQFATRPPPSAFDSHRFVQNRRSIVKRPSFLDIEDEMDAEGDANVNGGGDAEMARERCVSPLMDNFLEMGRGKDSFDTLRSYEEEVRVY